MFMNHALPLSPHAHPSAPAAASCPQLVRTLDGGGALDVSGIPDAFLRSRLALLLDNLVQLRRNSAVRRAGRSGPAGLFSVAQRQPALGAAAPSLTVPCNFVFGLPIDSCYPLATCCLAGPVLQAAGRRGDGSVLCGPHP